MCWDELAPDLSTWTVPAERAKNDKAHIVHLTDQARAVLAEVKRVRNQPLLFTTTGKTPISGFSNAIERLKEKIEENRAEAASRGPKGAPKPAPLTWRLHDFRRTGVTVLARLGVAPHVADRLLNHVQGTIRGVAAVYQRHEFMTERQRALETWANFLAPPPSSQPVLQRVSRRRKSTA